MRLKKIIALFAAALTASSLVLSGCGDVVEFLNTPAGMKTDASEVVDQDVTNLEVNYDNKYHIAIASGASGGAYYMVGTALAQVMQQADPNLICSSESTGGTNENLALISSEESQIGMGMADDIVDAYEGNMDFEGMPAVNLRAITAGQTNTFQIFVRKDSDIQTLEDLKGKNISLGPSGAPYFVPKLLRSICGYENGKDYNGQYLAHDQAADALSDGNIDAAIACLAYPASAFANLAFTKEVRLIPISDEQAEKAMAANPTWVRGNIPGGTYNGNDADSPSLDIPVWLFTYADLDAEAVYRCTKAIFENVDKLAVINAQAGKYNLETATDSITIPIHPGAQKYFDEMAEAKLSKGGNE